MDLVENPVQFLRSAQITLWNLGMHMEQMQLLRSETGNKENSFLLYTLLWRHCDKWKTMDFVGIL